jgi:hypothetical protein
MHRVHLARGPLSKGGFWEAFHVLLNFSIAVLQQRLLALELINRSILGHRVFRFSTASYGDWKCSDERKREEL